MLMLFFQPDIPEIQFDQQVILHGTDGGSAGMVDHFAEMFEGVPVRQRQGRELNADGDLIGPVRWGGQLDGRLRKKPAGGGILPELPERVAAKWPWVSVPPLQSMGMPM